MQTQKMTLFNFNLMALMACTLLFVHILLVQISGDVEPDIDATVASDRFRFFHFFLIMSLI